MSQHISAAQDTAQIKSQPVLSRSPQSALDIVEPELVEALSHVSEQLDIIVAQSLNDEAPAQALSEKLATVITLELGPTPGHISLAQLII